MGKLAEFLLALGNMVRRGDIRRVEDALRFAENQFGKVTPLLKKQIERIMSRGKNQEPGAKKEGEVIDVSFKPGKSKYSDKIIEESPSQKISRDQEDFLKRVGRQIEQDRKDLGPIDTKEEGITFSVPEEGIFNQKTSLEEVTNMLTKNPFRSGGGLDPVEGMTRTAARVVLGRKNIKVPEKADPIDIFEENFGGDALMDLRQAGEELLEKEQMGRITESMADFLESRGLFDLKVDKDAPKGITDEELLKKLTDDDPEEFAKGGRVGYDDGGITSLPKGLQKDTTTGEGANIFNMYAERPDAPKMAADEIAKVIMGTLGIEGDTTSRTFIFENYVMPKRKQLMENYGLTLQEADDLIREGMAKYRTEKATGGRVGYRYGSGLKLAKVLTIRGKTLVDEIKKAIDNFIQPSGDKKLDADVILDDMLEELNINRDEIDQKDILDAYDEIYTTLSKGDEISAMAPKMRERFELKEKYPGIDEELVTKIVDDPDPQRKAEVIATIEQAFELMKQGKSSDEVLDIMKQMTDRTKQAGGGLSYLSGF